MSNFPADSGVKRFWNVYKPPTQPLARLNPLFSMYFEDFGFTKCLPKALANFQNVKFANPLNRPPRQLKKNDNLGWSPAPSYSSLCFSFLFYPFALPSSFFLSFFLLLPFLLLLSSPFSRLLCPLSVSSFPHYLSTCRWGTHQGVLFKIITRHVRGSLNFHCFLHSVCERD